MKSKKIHCGLPGWTRIAGNNTGSVIVSVLAILFILLTIFIAVLTYFLARYSYHKKSHHEFIAAHLANAGIQRAISNINRNGINYDTSVFDTPNGGEVTSVVRPWGPFLLVQARGSYANQSKTSTALLGCYPTEIFQAAITVSNTRYPFVVAGQSYIDGDINTGPLGIATGKIRGQVPPQEDFHNGHNNIHQTITIPEIDSALVDKYFSDLNNRLASVEVNIPGSYIFTGDEGLYLESHSTLKIENNIQFKDFDYHTKNGKIKSIGSDGLIELKGKSNLKGLLEIRSDKYILVSDSSCLDQVVLYAEDSIVVAGNACFSGIAISRGKIVVKDKANLLYPSFLMINDPKSETDGIGIFLYSRGYLESVCCIPEVQEDRQSKPILFKDTATTFTGYLISHEESEIHGIVKGSIVTRQFNYALGVSTYINWVRDLECYRGLLEYEPMLPVVDNKMRNVDVIRQDTD